MDNSKVTGTAITLLKELIAIPSFSGEENGTALLLQDFLESHGAEVNRYMNNIWAVNKYYDPAKPAILLNSHHDTVKPNKDNELDPFRAIEKDGKLFGLGSNDAGGPLVCLVMAFLHFHERQDLPYNFVLAAVAEEEVSGKNGIQSLLLQSDFIGRFTNERSFAIVGEPTGMQMATVEKSLLVLDGVARGRAGHAARNEGDNAIYKAMMDIEWICCYSFENISSLLGPVKMTVTSIESANKAHNVIPSECRYVVDIRLNELYTPEEVLQVVRKNVQGEITPRRMSLSKNAMDPAHPLVQAGMCMGLGYFGSPTASDKALIPFPAVKMGPGDSARSHTKDEYIFTDEIAKGIRIYIELLNRLCGTSCDMRNNIQ